MPDHIHWLVQLGGDQKLGGLVQRLKGRSARRINLAHTLSSKVWQAGFHDHALRAEEDIEDVASYLIHNPLRAGLVDDYNEYPYWYSVWHSRNSCRG